MSNTASRLATLLSALTSARTPNATKYAQGALYQMVLPTHIRTCELVIQRTHGGVWQSAEDLAQDTLVDALPHLQRGVCPNLAGDGLLRWLATVAQRRLHDASRRQHGVQDRETAQVLRDTHACNSQGVMNSTVNEHTQRRDSLMHEYQIALAELPLKRVAAWQLVIEQELPMLEAADALGVHRATLHRHLTAARTHLAGRLQHFVAR